VSADIRYVNQLEDDDFDKKETKNTLKMLSGLHTMRHDQANIQDLTYATLTDTCSGHRLIF